MNIGFSGLRPAIARIQAELVVERTSAASIRIHRYSPNWICFPMVVLRIVHILEGTINTLVMPLETNLQPTGKTLPNFRFFFGNEKEVS